MDLKRLLTEERAVSPVIGVILMVAITVILAAVIGTFVLGLGDQVSQTTPNSSFQFDYDKNAPSENDTLDVVHGGGDTLAANELNASVTGALNATAPSDNVVYKGTLFGDTGDVSAGQSATIDETAFGGDYDETATASNGNSIALNETTVRVVWQSTEGDSSAQLGSWDGPDA